MAADEREARLVAERDAVLALAEASSILSVEHTGDPTNRYTLTFRGRGLTRESGIQGKFEFINEHKCELRIPYSFPQRPPDIRWLTPLFHPNVSYGGFISLAEIGLPWHEDVGLDAICERLWDVARLEYVNLEKTTNFAADSWFEDQSEVSLPVDQRPLRDREPQIELTNVVRYRRKGEPEVPPSEPEDTSDVLFIGEDTPPPIPARGPQRGPVRGRPRGTQARQPSTDDDDIFFIGE